MSEHDEEVERLRAGVSCATVLEKLTPGWSLDQRESTRRALKYRRGGGEILMGPDTIDALTRLLGALAMQACPRIVAATDADRAGERNASRLQEMAEIAGIPFERCQPPDGHKDWNKFLEAEAGRGRQ